MAGRGPTSDADARGWWMWWGVAAFAGGSAQTSFDRSAHGAHTELTYTWRGPDGADRVSFQVPSSAVADDQLEERYVSLRELNEAAVSAIEQVKVPRVHLTAEVQRGQISVRAEGTGNVERAMALAVDARDRAVEGWIAAHDLTRLADGSITFDHAALVSSYADALRPVADALADGTTSDRAFVERALAFVQSLPYEERRRRGGDPGYRRPLSVLAANRGDCDSKSVLFLGIVASRLPDTPLAVLYVPGHALVGVGLPKAKGDKSFTHDGVRLLYAEPVGPALLPLGGAVPSKHKVGKGEVHPVR